MHEKEEEEEEEAEEGERGGAEDDAEARRAEAISIAWRHPSSVYIPCDTPEMNPFRSAVPFWGQSSKVNSKAHSYRRAFFP